MSFRWKTTLIGVATAAVLAGSSEARELRIAPAAPPVHATYKAYEVFANEIKEASGGDLTATILGPEVISLLQVKDAQQSGLADVASFILTYFPAGLDNTLIPDKLTMIAREPYVMSLAFTDYIVNCAPCQKEFKELGFVFLGAISTDGYKIIATKPIQSLEDLKGMRIRAGTPAHARWLEHFGAVPVRVSVPEVFESLSQGSIDGSINGISDIVSWRWIDVMEGGLLIPLGSFFAASNFNMTADTWSSLSVDQRKIVADAAQHAVLQMTHQWGYVNPTAAFEAAKKKNVPLREPTADILAASQEFIDADSKEQIEANGELAVTFVGLMDKWSKIVDEVGGDLEALAARAQSEIWDKVDLSTYGL